MARAGGTHEFIFCQIQERKFHEFLEIFRASLKILWDPGSLPPLEYPTLRLRPEPDNPAGAGTGCGLSNSGSGMKEPDSSHQNSGSGLKNRN